MAKTVWLLDYGAGNVRSVANAINKTGFEVKTVKTAAELETADVWNPHVIFS